MTWGGMFEARVIPLPFVSLILIFLCLFSRAVWLAWFAFALGGGEF